MATSEFTKVERFESGKWYVAIQDWDEAGSFLPRLKTICHSLRKGDQLKFRGPNMGQAEFLTSDAKFLSLSPKLAFRLVGRRLTNHSSQPATDKEDWPDYDEIEDCGLRRSEIVVALK